MAIQATATTTINTYEYFRKSSSSIQAKCQQQAAKEAAEDVSPSACRPGSQVGHRTHSKGLSACTVSILECAINSRLSHVKFYALK